MYYDSWTCVMVKNGPGLIDDDVKLTLKLAACELSLSKIERTKVSTDACEAILQTEWKTAAIGTRIGILFRAQVTDESGDYKVNFLLSEDDLKRGAEFARDLREKEEISLLTRQKIPVAELYEFKDLRAHKLN